MNEFWRANQTTQCRRPTLLFYCQHSLGMGHLARAFALCEALTRRFTVVLLCGGKLPATKRPPEGVRIVPLPPLGAARDGTLLSHDAGRSVDDARDLRRRAILETFRSVRPEAVLVEFFPFGKRRFAGELLPLLAEAASRRPAAPVVVSSVRGILVGRGSEQQQFDDRSAELANEYFDAVLVHSDPAFASFEESFRPRVPLRIPVHHTGFVVPNGTSPNGAGPNGTRSAGDVVVSAGGGMVGVSLLRTAVAAHRLLGDVPMRVIGGPFFPEDAWQALREKAAGRPGLVLRRSVPDLGAELHAARASVSQSGYNTALDVLRAGLPALFVPFAENGEDEQTTRARRLADLGAGRVLDPEQLCPSRLAAEIRALLRFQPRPPRLDLGGGAATVRILAELHAARFGDRRVTDAPLA